MTSQEPTQEQIIERMKQDALYLGEARDMIDLNELAFATLLERKGMQPGAARQFVKLMLAIMNEFGCDLIEAIEKIEAGEAKLKDITSTQAGNVH